MNKATSFDKATVNIQKNDKSLIDPVPPKITPKKPKGVKSIPSQALASSPIHSRSPRKTTIITNLALDGGQKGTYLFKRAQESSGLPMLLHSLVGKIIELKPLHFPLKYYGIIVGGHNDYIHHETGDSMFLAKCIFVDLNSEFIEYGFDELDLVPTSPHKLDQACIVNLKEAIRTSDKSGWLHHTVSKPSPAARD